MNGRRIPLFSALLPLLAGMVLALTSAGSAPQTVRGRITFYGNAPAVFPGFETTAGKKYTIDVEEGSGLTLDELTARSGELLELTGKIKKGRRFPSLPDGNITVSAYTVVEQQE